MKKKTKLKQNYVNKRKLGKQMAVHSMGYWSTPDS